MTTTETKPKIPEDLADAVEKTFETHYAMLLRFAMRLSKSKVNARDLVATAMFLVLEQKRTWPREVKMHTFLCKVIGSIWMNERMSAGETRRAIGKKVERAAGADKHHPDKMLTSLPEEEAYEAFIEDVRKTLAGDEDGLLVYRSVVDEDREPEMLAEQAARLGWDKARCEKARRRVKYAVMKVAGQDVEE